MRHLHLSTSCFVHLQIFVTFFKTLEGKTIVVELKNDMQIRGTLASVDQYLNFKLTGVSAVDKERFPQLVSLTTYSCSSTLFPFN